MAYATLDQFVARLGQVESVQLSNLENPQAKAINAPKIQAALEDTTELINSYLQGRVDLSLLVGDAVPHILIGVNIDLARHDLDRNRRREDVQTRRDERIAWLKDVARGVVNLGLNGEDPASTTTLAPHTPYISERCQVFSNEALEGYL